MPDPLPSDVVHSLQSDRTAALAAALILAGAFPDLVAWAMRAFSGGAGPASGEPKAKTNGAAKSNGAKAGAHHPEPDNSREGAARRDQALLKLMRENPGASVTRIIRMSGRPRNSAVLSLERLQKAGLIEHAGRGQWAVIDPDLLEAPAPKPAGWIAPLSGAQKARHSADGRVRDELTLAGA
jgi:hypothetical protein